MTINAWIIIHLFILESKFTVSINGDEEEARRFDSNKNNVVDTNSDEVNNILIKLIQPFVIIAWVNK